MKKEKKPPHIKNLFDTIRCCIEKSKYTMSKHSELRGKERSIHLPDVLYVLKNGYHEQEKLSFDEGEWTWKYAIRHKIEFKDIRVIIAFKNDHMYVITVMQVTKQRD